jgi:rubredoxin
VTQQWICEACGYIYDPADGDVDGGIPPGTAFEEIPDDWFCPVCAAHETATSCRSRARFGTRMISLTLAGR